MADPRNRRPPIPQWRQGIGPSLGSKRDQSLSSAYSSDAVNSSPRTTTTNNTPKTPPSPSPLRNFITPEDVAAEEHATTTAVDAAAATSSKNEEEDFNDIMNKLHEAMWNDVLRRKAGQYVLNEESGMYERKPKKKYIVEDNYKPPKKETLEELIKRAEEEKKLESEKDVSKEDKYRTLPATFRFPAPDGVVSKPIPYTPPHVHNTFRGGRGGGMFGRGGHYRGASGSFGSMSTQHSRNFSGEGSFGGSPSGYGHNRNISGDGFWRGGPSGFRHYRNVSGEGSWRGSPSARGHHRNISSGEGFWRGSPTARGHHPNSGGQGSWRGTSNQGQYGNFGGGGSLRGTPSTRGHHRNLSWRNPSTNNHSHLKNFGGGGSWRAPPDTKVTYPEGPLGTNKVTYPNGPLSTNKVTYPDGPLNASKVTYPDGPHGTSKFLQSQLRTIRLNSLMAQKQFGVKDEDERGRKAPRDSKADKDLGEKKAFRIRIHRSLSPPGGRKPIRLSDSHKLKHPSDFTAIKRPPRRKLCGFTVHHADFEDDDDANPGDWLQNWNDKHHQPFSRPAAEMQWQVKIQRKEPVDGFKHPIAPEYDGCLTLPHIPPGKHFKDIRPTENKTLQENAQRATNRPAMQDEAEKIPRHERVLRAFPERRGRKDMPRVLNQFLLGDLRKLDKFLKKFLKDNKTITRSTLEKYPELYVFDPVIDDSTEIFSPTGSERSLSTRSSSAVWSNDEMRGIPVYRRPVIPLSDPEIRAIFEAPDNPPRRIQFGHIEDTGQPKNGPLHFSILRSYNRAIVGWPERQITGRPIPQSMCPKFDGKNGVIYLEEHRFENIVQLMETADPLLAPMVRDVTSVGMQKWLEITEPEFQYYMGIRHNPMSPFIPTPRGFGRWGEFRWIAATGHWILYFFPKPHDWAG